MTPSLRVLLLSCAALPLSGHAATYKCVVDGRTTYQQRPCAADATQHEIETGPPKRVPAARSVPAAEAAAAAPTPAGAAGTATKGELDAAGREALARESFAALKRRDLDRFGTMLCASARQKYSRPDTKSTLPMAARGFAARGTEIGDVLANEPKYVHFAVSERDADAAPPARTSSERAFSVGLDRDTDGRTCVAGFGTVVRSAR